MGSSLTDKTVFGVGWSFLDNISNSGITFLVGLVLARLLSPEEYGLIGIITIFIVLFSAIVDSGFSAALIRKKDIERKDYDTAFWANLFLGSLMYILLFFLAKPIALFFNREELVPLTQVMGVILSINAFSTIQRTIYTKKLNFKVQTGISLLSSLGSGVIGIGMAFYGYGVWSLVGQQLSRQTIQSVFLWYWSDWRPMMRFSLSSFKSMYSFGWKLMLSNVINTLWNEAYQIVIGKCYAPSTLGQYTRAKQFSDIFSTNLTTVVQRVTFPSLSEIQDEDERLKEAYRRVLKITMLLSFMFLFCLASISKSLIYTLIGTQWEEAVHFLPIICLQCVFYPLSAINLNILMVKGRSDIYLQLEIIKRIISIIPLLMGIFLGIYWMLWGSVVYGMCAYTLNSYFSGRMIDYSIWNQLKDLIPSFLPSALTAIIISSISILDMPSVVILALQLSAGFVIAYFLLSITRNQEFLFIKSMVLSIYIKTKSSRIPH